MTITDGRIGLRYRGKPSDCAPRTGKANRSIKKITGKVRLRIWRSHFPGLAIALVKKSGEGDR